MLAHGEQIGRDLTRVVLIGEPVDHRHRRVRASCATRSWPNVRITIIVAVARQHARGVLDRLAARDLRALRRQVRRRDRRARTRRPRTTRACASRPSRTRARPSCLPACVCDPLALELVGAIEDRGPAIGGDVAEGEEAARRGHLPTPSASTLREDADGLVELLARRRCTAARSARPWRRRPSSSTPFSRHAPVTCAGASVDGEAPQQAAAAHGHRVAREFVDELAEPLARDTAPACDDALEQAFGLDDVEHRRGRRARERIAAERRRVRDRAAAGEVEAGRRLLARGERADRHAAAEALRERHHVGRRRRRAACRTIVPVRPTPVWTSSKISTVPVSSHSRRSAREEARRRDDDAALGLDRLDDDRARGALLEHARGRFEIVVRDVLDRTDERTEALAILRLARDRDGRERAAVERVDRRHERRCAAAAPATTA